MVEVVLGMAEGVEIVGDELFEGSYYFLACL